MDIKEKGSTASVKKTRKSTDDLRATGAHGVRYVVNEAGERLEVVIPIAVYEDILEQLEDADDVLAYDEAKRDSGDPVPLREIRESLGI